MQTNIYLDIDGVLLANDLHAANGAHEFLEYVTTHFPRSTYWLTTHCQGDAQTAVDRLAKVFGPSTTVLLHSIQATTWRTAKTEAIDFSKPFLWFDDDLFPDERAVLLDRGVLDSWIGVDLAKDENQLKRFIQSFPLPAA